MSKAQAYEPSKGYVFEITDKDGRIRDRFSFYGPFSAGHELAERRAALYGAGVIWIWQD